LALFAKQAEESGYPNPVGLMFFPVSTSSRIYTLLPPVSKRLGHANSATTFSICTQLAGNSETAKRWEALRGKRGEESCCFETAGALAQQFEVLCGDSLAVSSQINIAELLVVARSQEESIVSRFEADVLSVIADTLTQAGTAARWERHGIGAQELAMHLLDTSAGAKSATGNLSDYKRRMALSIRIIVMGANGGEI